MKFPFFSGNSGWENKLRVSKNFLGVYLFASAEYLCNRNPKIRTKNFKNSISILVIVNYRNWLNASFALILFLD